MDGVAKAGFWRVEVILNVLREGKEQIASRAVPRGSSILFRE